MKLILSIIITIFLVTFLNADVLQLKDGTIYKGKVVDDNSTTYTFQITNEKIILKANIHSLDITGTDGEKTNIIPKPQSIKWTGIDFFLYSTTQIFYPRVNGEDHSLTASLLEDELHRVNQFAQIAAIKKVTIPNTPVILLDIVRPDSFCTIKPTSNLPEAYTIKVTKNRIEICGNTSIGTFYGMQTLIQLMKGDRVTGYKIRGVEIDDFPQFPMRILHLPRLTVHTDLNLYKKLVQLAARVKMNTLIVENSGAILLDKHPEAYDVHGFTKQEIRDLVQYMKRYHFTVIPELNSAGHVSEWLGHSEGDVQKYHLENVFENATTRYTLCPSSESTFHLLFDVYDEMLEVFDHPVYFHVGLDEIYRSEYGTDIRCKGKDKPTLYAHYIDRLDDYFSQRTVKMIMWGDLLLNPEQFTPLEDCNGGSPTHFYKTLDIVTSRPIIMDWHYGRFDYTPTAQYFQQHGYPVIPTSWNRSANIYNQSHTAMNLGLNGYCGSMWNFLEKGYDPDSEIEIMSSPIVQGDYMWNPNNYPVNKIPYDPEKIFHALWPTLIP